jgi:hypothetical protein
MSGSPRRFEGADLGHDRRDIAERPHQALRQLAEEQSPAGTGPALPLRDISPKLGFRFDELTSHKPNDACSPSLNRRWYKEHARPCRRRTNQPIEEHAMTARCPVRAARDVT